MESYMEMLANHAKHAAVAAAKLGTAEKNKGLCAVADTKLIMQRGAGHGRESERSEGGRGKRCETVFDRPIGAF